MAGAYAVSLDPAFGVAIPGVVADVESRTSAEIVVVVYRTTPPWGWVAGLSGLAGGLVSLAACLWTPFSIVESGVLSIVAASAVLSAALGELVYRRTRPLPLRQARALRRARAAFVRYGVHQTRERTGLVLLLDEVERRVELVVDTGVEGAVSTGLLDSVVFGGGPDGRDLAGLQPVLDGLRTLGGLLAEGLPANPDDNPEELDNAPRILP